MGVFDEERWFAPGSGDPLAFEVAGVRVGVSICEDLWFPCGPVAELGAEGAQLVVNLNASPYSIGRRFDRLAVLADQSVPPVRLSFGRCAGRAPGPTRIADQP